MQAIALQLFLIVSPTIVESIIMDLEKIHSSKALLDVSNRYRERATCVADQCSYLGLQFDPHSSYLIFEIVSREIAWPSPRFWQCLPVSKAVKVYMRHTYSRRANETASSYLDHLNLAS